MQRDDARAWSEYESNADPTRRREEDERVGSCQLSRRQRMPSTLSRSHAVPSLLVTDLLGRDCDGQARPQHHDAHMTSDDPRRSPRKLSDPACSISSRSSLKKGSASLPAPIWLATDSGEVRVAAQSKDEGATHRTSKYYYGVPNSLLPIVRRTPVRGPPVRGPPLQQPSWETFLFLRVSSLTADIWVNGS